MQPDLLSQLQDIQTPEPISWWPLAWGWWCLIVMLIVVLVLIARFILQRIKRLRAKKSALLALSQIDKNGSPLDKVKSVNNLLKRVVLVYADRTEVAGLSGKAWADWLNAHCTKGPAFDDTLVSLAYQANCTAEQAERFSQQAQAWISNNLPITANQGDKHV